MTIKDIIRLKCKSKGISLPKLEETLGFGAGTISKWDKSAPSIDKLSKVANYFEITIDELIGDSFGSHTTKISPKDQRDLSEFLNNTEIMFDGELHQLDDEDRDKLRHALEFVFWQAKEKNKRKPTE